MSKKYLLNEDSNVKDELYDYVNEMFTPVTKDHIFRCLRIMDKFGYKDYSFDLYNFINVTEVSVDQDEEKLLFISLIISHAISLLEDVGLIINKDILDDDYFSYLKTFVLMLESLWLVRDMTEIDIIYFSGLIDNDNLQDMEILFRILQYYSQELTYTDFYYVVKDYKPSFYNTIKNKINDLSMSNLDTVDDELNIEDINNLYVVIDALSIYVKNSKVIQLLTTTLSDFKYLIKSNDFIKNNISEILKNFIKELDSNKPDNYYLFIKDNKEVFTMVFDMVLLEFLFSLTHMDKNFNDSLKYGLDSVKDIFYDYEFKNISGLLDILKDIGNILENVFNNENFRNNLIKFLGKDNNG